MLQTNRSSCSLGQPDVSWTFSAGCRWATSVGRSRPLLFGSWDSGIGLTVYSSTNNNHEDWNCWAVLALKRCHLWVLHTNRNFPATCSVIQVRQNRKLLLSVSLSVSWHIINSTAAELKPAALTNNEPAARFHGVNVQTVPSRRPRSTLCETAHSLTPAVLPWWSRAPLYDC